MSNPPTTSTTTTTTALLDECNPSPCFFPQSCIDPNTSISSTGDYVCTCPDGTDKVGGSLAVCGMPEHCLTLPPHFPLTTTLFV